MSAENEFTVHELIQASSAAHLEQARRLFREYAAWLDVDLCFQSFEKELAELPGDYAPPNGRLFLLFDGDQLAGCVALRKIGEDVCEMKRLFLRAEFRGKGLGRLLVNSIIQAARQIGYGRMRLDTLPLQMSDAISLYRSMGFKEIEPYYDNPVVGAKFMEIELK